MSTAPVPPPPNQSQDFPRELRYIFVQLLFSLTAAETARQFAMLVGAGYNLLDGAAAYAHLLLAGMVVVTSWVGWVKSDASRQLRVEDVFSLRFLVLLMDVGLVFLYFLLVRSAEIPMPNKPGEALPPVEPSACPEAVVLAGIFSGYFAWDVLTKGFIQLRGAPDKMLVRFLGRTLWKRGWISLACMILAMMAAWPLHAVSGKWSVVMVDFALLSLVFLFRACKEERWWIGGILGTCARGFGIIAGFIH